MPLQQKELLFSRGTKNPMHSRLCNQIEIAAIDCWPTPKVEIKLTGSVVGHDGKQLTVVLDSNQTQSLLYALAKAVHPNNQDLITLDMLRFPKFTE